MLIICSSSCFFSVDWFTYNFYFCCIICFLRCTFWICGFLFFSANSLITEVSQLFVLMLTVLVPNVYLFDFRILVFDLFQLSATILTFVVHYICLFILWCRARTLYLLSLCKETENNFFCVYNIIIWSELTSGKVNTFTLIIYSGII